MGIHIDCVHEQGSVCVCEPTFQLAAYILDFNIDIIHELVQLTVFIYHRLQRNDINWLGIPPLSSPLIEVKAFP